MGGSPQKIVINWLHVHIHCASLPYLLFQKVLCHIGYIWGKAIILGCVYELCDNAEMSLVLNIVIVTNVHMLNKLMEC